MHPTIHPRCTIDTPTQASNFGHPNAWVYLGLSRCIWGVSVGVSGIYLRCIPQTHRYTPHAPYALISLNMPQNGLICHIWDVSGECIQCVSREYPGVYPGCILGASLVYPWVYLGVSGRIRGASGGVSKRGVNRVAKGHQRSVRDRS